MPERNVSVSETPEEVIICLDMGASIRTRITLSISEAVQLFAGLQIVHRLAGEEPRRLIHEGRKSALDEVRRALEGVKP